MLQCFPYNIVFSEYLIQNSCALQENLCTFYYARSQWLCCLRDELSSTAWTLGSRVQIFLGVCWYYCTFSVSMLYCMGSGFVTDQSLVKGVVPDIYKQVSERKLEALDYTALSYHTRWKNRRKKVFYYVRNKLVWVYYKVFQSTAFFLLNHYELLSDSVKAKHFINIIMFNKLVNTTIMQISDQIQSLRSNQ